MTPRRADTLARRLARTLMLATSAVWIAGVLAVGWYVNTEIAANFDHELAETASRAFDIALQDLQPGTAQVQLASPPVLPSDDPLVLQLVDRQGRLRLRTEAAPGTRFDVPLANGFARTPGWRVYTVAHPTLPWVLHVADPSRERRVARNRALVGLLVPMGAMLLLLGVVVHATARSELAVLSRLGLQIASRSADDLRPLPLDGLPAELHAVGGHVNHLLLRLADALDVERALAANAAHELRTPLAAVRLRLQTALDHGAVRTDVQAALDALGTLAARTEKLLQLSRAESASAQAGQPVDLARVAALVVREFESERQAAGRLGVQAAGGPVRVRGDIDALAIALRNLVENALRYAEGPVEVLAHRDAAGSAVLAVTDGGPGVPPERLAQLVQRHVRDSPERAGYGLGLSIATSIAVRHGGRLELQSPPPGRAHGLQARLVLPFAPE